eukprot:superscaffoldBa00001202_g9476
MEQACEGSLTRPKKAIPRGCGDDDEEDEESILDTVLKGGNLSCTGTQPGGKITDILNLKMKAGRRKRRKQTGVDGGGPEEAERGE